MGGVYGEGQADARGPALGVDVDRAHQRPLRGVGVVPGVPHPAAGVGDQNGLRGGGAQIPRCCANLVQTGVWPGSGGHSGAKPHVALHAGNSISLLCGHVAFMKVTLESAMHDAFHWEKLEPGAGKMHDGTLHCESMPPRRAISDRPLGGGSLPLFQKPVTHSLTRTQSLIIFSQSQSVTPEGRQL